MNSLLQRNISFTIALSAFLLRKTTGCVRTIRDCTQWNQRIIPQWYDSDNLQDRSVAELPVGQHHIIQVEYGHALAEVSLTAALEEDAQRRAVGLD